MATRELIALNEATPELTALTASDVGEFKGSLQGADAAGAALLDEAATTTNPTLIPNKAELDTGWGWASDVLHAVVGGATVGNFSASAFTLPAGIDLVIGEGKFSITSTANEQALAVTSNSTSAFSSAITSNSSTTGGSLDILNGSGATNTRSIVRIRSVNGTAVNATILELAQAAVTSTNFKKIVKFDAFTLWTSDGTTAEGALTGVEGDICLNGGTGAGQMAYCDAAGTNWTDM